LEGGMQPEFEKITIIVVKDAISLRWVNFDDF
jgi:hypothetical protein